MQRGKELEATDWSAASPGRDDLWSHSPCWLIRPSSRPGLRRGLSQEVEGLDPTARLPGTPRPSPPWGRRRGSALGPRPGPVPGGVQSLQRLPGKVVGAKEQHPPGRLLADSGASAVPAGGAAEPGRCLTRAARPPSRQPRTPAAPNQEHHLSPAAHHAHAYPGGGVYGRRPRHTQRTGRGLSRGRLDQIGLTLRKKFDGII